MNIWYAVYVTGQTNNLPIALFQYASQAADFVKLEYPDRAETKTVTLNGSMQLVTVSKEVILIS
jgi:hypothetical protein